MRKIILIAVLAVALPAAVGLLSGCGGCGPVAPSYILPSPAPTPDPHLLDRIEDGDLNWSYWPDVVKTPVFGD